jgi:fibronectin type 3 domain-containing protein
MQFSNDNTTYGTATAYDSLNPSTTWVIGAGDGSKSVWAKYTDGASNVSTIGPHTIVLDQTKPTVPGTLSRTVSCSGTNRTTNLAWGASTDTNFLGYRIYKSVNGAAYAALATTAGTSYSDVDKKTLDSLSYKVVGYDKAGNESSPTNVISFSKNQCS